MNIIPLHKTQSGKLPTVILLLFCGFILQRCFDGLSPIGEENESPVTISVSGRVTMQDGTMVSNAEVQLWERTVLEDPIMGGHDWKYLKATGANADGRYRLFYSMNKCGWRHFFISASLITDSLHYSSGEHFVHCEDGEQTIDLEL